MAHAFIKDGRLVIDGYVRGQKPATGVEVPSGWLTANLTPLSGFLTQVVVVQEKAPSGRELVETVKKMLSSYVPPMVTTPRPLAPYELRTGGVASIWVDRSRVTVGETLHVSVKVMYQVYEKGALKGRWPVVGAEVVLYDDFLDPKTKKVTRIKRNVGVTGSDGECRFSEVMELEGVHVLYAKATMPSPKRETVMTPSVEVTVAGPTWTPEELERMWEAWKRTQEALKWVAFLGAAAGVGYLIYELAIKPRRGRRAGAKAGRGK